MYSKFTTTANIELILKPVANIFLFKNQNQYPTVQIPKSYIKSQDRWVENPSDPRYEEAQLIVETEKTLDTFTNLIKLCVSLNDVELLNDIRWKKQYRILLRENSFLEDISEEKCFIKYRILTDFNDQYEVVNTCCLTEAQVFQFYSSFTITRNGLNVNDVEVRNAINTGIDLSQAIVAGLQLVNPLDEYNAVVASELNWVDWIRNGYTNEEKAATVALYRLDRLKNLHIEDEQQIQQEKKK